MSSFLLKAGADLWGPDPVTVFAQLKKFASELSAPLPLLIPSYGSSHSSTEHYMAVQRANNSLHK